MTAFTTLAQLVEPLSLDVFLGEYYDRRPVHLPGSPERSRGLLTHDRLTRLLRDGDQASGSVISFPLPVEGATEDPVAAYAAYFDAGYPVILNAPHGASREIDRICTDLGAALQAHVWPNVYATGTAGAPFNIHFDLHDVLVVQCEGEKEWQISSLRADRPLDVPEMRGTFEDAVEAMREQALASVAMTFTVKPGDVVYIPRGQFHMATTPSGRSLHVTFAIRPLCGYDLAQALCRLALADPRLRDYLPDLDQGPVSDQTHDRLAEFKDRLKELLDGPNLTQALAAVRADLMAQSNGNREAQAETKSANPNSI